MGSISRYLLKKAADGLKDEQRLKIEMSDSKSVPECFHFNRERRMPIAEINGEDGFFMFPSQQSLENFENTKKYSNELSPDAIGIPLFQIINCTLPFGKRGHSNTVVGNVPYYKIFKFILRTADEPPPYTVAKIVCSNNGLILYKVPLYDIYKNVSQANVTYSFVGTTSTEPNLLAMAHREGHRDLDTKVNNLNLRWHVTYSPVVTNDHYKLILLADYEVNRLDEDVIRAAKNKMSTDQKDQKVQRFVAAHYTREFETSLFRWVAQEGHLILGEYSTDQGSFGLNNIPPLTEELGCQSLLIHYIEYMKRQRKKIAKEVRRQNKRNVANTTNMNMNLM
ncbi:Dia1p [Saccharomyces cerevisiae PE-2]|uniref:Dia1p n=1 Tax=Saccharomyces cerevisiae (strain JAY291) TaxID=574961 RepID=C7GPU6_YEAS2|nr:Dia1p [Saccharomyces cerevisiae JAY291]CAF1599220.1 Dia1p [Saccharomyces cerevisiae PE-2]